MQIAKPPADEAARIAALQRYDILDTAPEESFDEITRLASYICGTAISTMTLVDTERQWFKSRVGLDATETPRDLAFCAHTILSPEALVVPDALQDVRFVDNPLVTDNPNIRFYAGIPLVTPDGFALGALCAIDRVPRQLSGQQLEAMRTLAKQVVQTMELRQSHRQLNELAKRLSRVNEGKDQLFSMISHDLRSPVGGVLGMLELLAEEVPNMQPWEVRDHMHMLAGSARGTFELLESLLQWSLFSAGQMKFTPEPVALDQMLRQVTALTGVAAARKAITLEIAEDSGLTVLADPAMLRSVLQNLVANAVKFTPAKGCVSVSVSIQGGRAAIAVRDSGVGMSPERLREVSQRSGSSTDGTEGEQGTGLGLKVCRTFIENHGGVLSATSQPGQGTTFAFTLPLAPTGQ